MMPLGDSDSDERLVLGDLLNHVLDKGVVIAGDVTISVADIDLIRVGLSVFITAVETLEQQAQRGDRLPSPDDDVRLLLTD
jgi:hypothetical protein